MRGLVLVVCLAAFAGIATFAGCGGGGENMDETIAPVTDTVATSEEPDDAGGKGDGGKPRDKPEDEASAPDIDVDVLSAEVDAIGEQTGAEVGVAIAPPGAAPIELGSFKSGSAWSTIKVPIALQVINEAGGVSGLTPEQTSNITAAITLSDNGAAAALFQDLVATHGSVEAASQAVTDLLREAGDNETVVSSTSPSPEFSTYGQTDWSLTAQTIFMSALLNGCIGEPTGRDFVLTQMSQVTSDTWGLGSASTAALWKGGWGPGPGGYLARQMGQIEIGGEQYAVAIAANAGTFEEGQAADSAVAQWMVDNIPTLGTPTGC